MTKKAFGLSIEKEAKAYLIQQGFKHITSNYRCNMGEIDLIMQDKEHLVFVEVRHRSKDHYGDGFDSVDKRKQRKIIRTAQYYLLEAKLYDKIFCRFDVVATSYQGGKLQLEWLPNAFLTHE